MPDAIVGRALLFSVAIFLGGCASQVRELMPTPAIFDSPATQAIFEQVPPERRRSSVDLL